MSTDNRNPILCVIIYLLVVFIRHIWHWPVVVCRWNVMSTLISVLTWTKEFENYGHGHERNEYRLVGKVDPQCMSLKTHLDTTKCTIWIPPTWYYHLTKDITPYTSSFHRVPDHSATLSIIIRNRGRNTVSLQNGCICSHQWASDLFLDSLTPGSNFLHVRLWINDISTK